LIFKGFQRYTEWDCSQVKRTASAPPAKTIASNTAAKAPKTIKEHAARKVREAKLAAGHTKRKVRAAGTAAKAHVTRNRAAYIAGGAGLAAGAIGSAVLARRKNAKSEN
jgi:hypothetical protein